MLVIQSRNMTEDPQTDEKPLLGIQVYTQQKLQKVQNI
jgi:hypothetical protein